MAAQTSFRCNAVSDRATSLRNAKPHRTAIAHHAYTWPTPIRIMRSGRITHNARANGDTGGKCKPVGRSMQPYEQAEGAATITCREPARRPVISYQNPSNNPLKSAVQYNPSNIFNNNPFKYQKSSSKIYAIEIPPRSHFRGSKS